MNAESKHPSSLVLKNLAFASSSKVTPQNPVLTPNAIVVAQAPQVITNITHSLASTQHSNTENNSHSSDSTSAMDTRGYDADNPFSFKK